MNLGRRTVLTALGSAAALAASAPGATAESAAVSRTPAGDALARLLPRHHDQVTFRTLPHPAVGSGDAFRVSGSRGRVLVEGTTPAVQLTGFHHYLRHHAHAHFSWTGEQTESLPARLPGLTTP
ncbi:alpha-N-acetylglucosaminidase N-terminal domain-containing protein [Streptomyces sp. NPDC058320]